MIPQDFPSCHNSSVPALEWLLLLRDGRRFSQPPLQIPRKARIEFAGFITSAFS
jgi:hypothetical protein